MVMVPDPPWIWPRVMPPPPVVVSVIAPLVSIIAPSPMVRPALPAVTEMALSPRETSWLSVAISTVVADSASVLAADSVPVVTMLVAARLMYESL